jgi:hypothetical protein
VLLFAFQGYQGLKLYWKPWEDAVSAGRQGTLSILAPFVIRVILQAV